MGVGGFGGEMEIWKLVDLLAPYLPKDVTRFHALIPVEKQLVFGGWQRGAPTLGYRIEGDVH